MEQDQYEARLKELFDSFDTTGTGSLGQEELTDLCLALQLEDVASSLQQALLQDNPHGRVHFDQFKEALIDVLSSRLSDKDSFEEQDCSPEVQPKYIKDGKKYGRRSVPELQDSLEEFDEETVIEAEDEVTRSSQVSSRNCEELWKSVDGEEYEAEGQLRFWNPDDLNASQNVLSPAQDWVEEKLQLVCEDLGISRDGHLNRKKLVSICEQYGFQNIDKEALEDVFQNIDQDDTMSLQEFISKVCKNTKPLTPSSSTPYRHLKRHLSMPSYDESGRRTLTPSTMTGSIGFRLFSKLDDGTGYGSVEDIIDLWHEDGVENSHAILKALDFNLEGKINLTELTMTLENELLMTKNEVYQAALTSFRSEIRHLLESAEQAAREKEKLRSDLERNERFKSLMASEVDDHHAAIERRNEYNLRKLDDEYKERTSILRNELRKEREQILQQTSRQRQELEQELDKVKTEENILRDRLMLSLKESSRLENELLETSEKLLEYETLACKLQKSLDNILREKFGDLDPSCIEFFRQEEKLSHMRNEFERQRRELQDRIDELQLELEEYRLQGVRGFRSSLKNSLSFEMDSKNVVECDQGIGAEECPPLNMSIEAEMAIEQMREQHQREVENLTVELESKVIHYEEQVKEIKCSYEREKEIVQQKYQKEAQITEEQIRLLKSRHVELEADIVKLKEEKQMAISKHKQELSHIETDFNNQRVQLVERETVLQVQLEEVQRAFYKEKEILVQKALELERNLEMKMAEMVRNFEKEKDHLEHTFKEQISSYQERLDLEKNDLKTRLLEKHQMELQEEREKMETEYNRRLVEKEDRFGMACEAAARKHKEALASLEEKFQNNLQELVSQHTEEKAKWQLEKEELIQEDEKVQSGLQKILEEKSTACSTLAEEKDLLEKNYMETLNKLITERDDLHKALEKCKVTAKKEKQALSGKITQLENDLKEEVTEKDEQICNLEKNVQVLEETIEKLEQKLQTEKKVLESKLLESEISYREVRELEDGKKKEMVLEVSALQSTISGLQNEISNLSKRKEDLKLLEKENADLKVVLSRLQDNLVHLEEERSVLRNLQNIYEHTVKENVRLNAEISRLQNKLDMMEQDISKAIETAGNQIAEALSEEESHSLKSLLEERAELLRQSERNVQNLRDTIEKLEQKHKTEKEELNSRLVKSEIHYRELCEAEKSKKNEMLREISTLQSTVDDLQNEIATMTKLQGDLNLLVKENSDLRVVVSQLQNNSVCQMEERAVLINQQNGHEQTLKENLELIAEISRFKKKLEIMECDTSKASETEGSLQRDHVEGKDLKVLLTERAELLIRSERTVQMLKETIEKLEQRHKTEKEELNSRLVKSEILYKEVCELEKNKKEEMVTEISILQSTISGLQNEIASLSKLQGDLKSSQKENSDLKAVVSQLQVNTDLSQEEKNVLRNLQNTHEQTVKENVRLNAEISRLHKNINIMEHSLNKASESKGNPVLSDGMSNIEDPMNEQNVETLEDANLRLHFKTKEHKCTMEIFKDLEKCYEDTKTENGHLRAQVLLLQEDLNHLSLEYDLFKKMMNSADFEFPELEEMHVTIPGLKMLLSVAKKENVHLLENLKVMESKNKEAVENNRELSSEVSWLQNEIQNMEEMAEASLKLENLYEDTKNENQELKELVTKLQEKIHDFKRKPDMKSVLDKEIQTTDLTPQFSLEHYAKNAEMHSPTTLSPPTVSPSFNVENCLTHQQHERPKDTFPIPKQVRKEEGITQTSEIFKSGRMDLAEESGLMRGAHEQLVCHRCLQTEKEQDLVDPEQISEMMKNIDVLRCENNELKEERSALKYEIATLEEECDIHNQKMTALQEACEEMWVNFETVQNEKIAVQNLVETLTKQVSELKSKNQQLDSQNSELYIKNTKNQSDIHDLNNRLRALLKHKDKREARSNEEWQREKNCLKDEIEGYRSKVSDSEKELSKVQSHNHILEQEIIHLKQEIDAKQHSRSSEFAEFKKEISRLTTKTENLLKEKETLNEELNRCVEKCAKVGFLENKIASLKQEQNSLEQQSQGLKCQLTVSQEKIQSLEESLHTVNIQLSRIKSDLRVAWQEKEALKQEVMSLHKQLQNANAKNQVLEMAMHSSGLQNNQKKLYWDDLEQLMEQEQQLLRQENERLQREIQNTKTDLIQSREKVRQLESTVLSLKQQKQQSQSSMVKVLEQEKLSLKRECDQLQKELTSANRKISQLASVGRETDTIMMENEGFRSNVGKFDEHRFEALHSASSVALSHPPLQQQASVTVPVDQYLQCQPQLQQADRRNQQLHATSRSSETNSPQSDQEQLLRRMETRMTEVEQKLRIVKMLLQEKVNQLKEQVARNMKTDAKLKDLYVDNSQLLRALAMSEERHQTAAKKNYLLEEKISGLNKIVRDLAPSALTSGNSPRRFSQLKYEDKSQSPSTPTRKHALTPNLSPTPSFHDPKRRSQS
ncbi:ninein isoform X1 [Pelobates cultripes]|nr:ninein isoform X1 [Pelobates cultripes]